MAVTTKILFPATSNATTTDFSLSGLELNNQDDLDVYVTLSGGTRRLGLRQSTDTTAIASHPQVNNTDGLYYPPVSVGDQLKNYTLVNNNGTVRFNNALPTGSIVFVERRTRDASGSYTAFTSGSTIRASELNRAFDEANFTAQEARNKAFDLEGKIYNALGTANTVVKTTDTGSVTSTMITDGTIVNADINASANIQGSKLLNDSVTLDKLGAGALPTDITIASANITNGTIINEDINGSAAIAGTKVTPSFGSQNLSITGTSTFTGNIVVSGTVDGRDVAADGTKLDGVESGATADQSNAEIRAAVEAATDSNVFTDADHTKLNGVQALATDDQTASEIKTLLQSDKLTSAEIATGTLDNRYYTETEADAAFLRQDSSETIASGVTWSSVDSKVATTAAIDARIIDLVDDVGGFVAIANQTSFPTANPDVNNGAGTIVSVKAASTNLTAQSGTTLTIANGAGSGNTVTVTGVSATIPSGYGFLVETTTTLHTYSFHRLVPKATEVSTVAANAVNIAAAGANVTNIDSFADRYQISTSAPTTRVDSSSLTNGDLWFDSSSNKVMMVYDGSAGDGFSPITPNQATLTNINIVAGQVTYTEDLGNITDAVNTGSGNNSVNTVGANISSVQTAATNIAKINTVADDLNEGTSEIDTVATNITNVNNVGNNISNVNAVHNNASNINAAVSNATNINSAVSNASNINTVAGNNTNINTVAGANSNITTVAGSISNVNTAATNIASINTTAASIANVNNFTDRYQVASSAPSTDGGGNSLAAGDLYFDTGASELKVYSGSAWQGGVTATGNFATKTGNTFTGNNTYNDNVKALFGTGSDLEIFHSGTNSVIKDAGTGSLIIAGNAVEIKNTAGTEISAKFIEDSSVELYHNNSKKIETTSTGATITGLMTATTIDGAAGSNLQLDFGTLT